MKKIILFAMIIGFLLSGCNGLGEDDFDKPDISSSPILTSTPIESPQITPSDSITSENRLQIYYLADNTHKYTNIDSWQEYIKDKFGIEVKVNYFATTPEHIISGKKILDGILYLNTVEGIQPLFNTYVFDYATSAIAVELSQYYKKYGWDQYIDSQYLDMLYNNGAIYAVPAVNSKYIVPRYYNADYLDELSMEVPSSLSEFYNFLKETKKLNANDPNFYPTIIWSHAMTGCTADIFRAHDIYVNSAWNNYFAYNPNTATFENAVFADEFETALTYLRNLQTENLMAVNGISNFNNEEGETVNMFLKDIKHLNENFATEYNYVCDLKNNKMARFDLFEPSYKKVNGYYLSGTSPGNVCEIRSDISFYIFPKTLDNINGTIDFFNDLFTDIQYYADFRYGIEGTDYLINDDRITAIRPQTGKFMGLKQIKYIEDPNSCYVPESLDIVDTITRGLAYESNVFNQFRTYLDSSASDSIRVGGTFFDILFYDTISPYDAIQMYKEEFKVRGWEKIIDDLNESLGTVSAYDYYN